MQNLELLLYSSNTNMAWVQFSAPRRSLQTQTLKWLFAVSFVLVQTQLTEPPLAVTADWGGSDKVKCFYYDVHRLWVFIVSFSLQKGGDPRRDVIYWGMKCEPWMQWKALRSTTVHKTDGVLDSCSGPRSFMETRRGQTMCWRNTYNQEKARMVSPFFPFQIFALYQLKS